MYVCVVYLQESAQLDVTRHFEGVGNAEPLLAPAWFRALAGNHGLQRHKSHTHTHTPTLQGKEGAPGGKGKDAKASVRGGGEAEVGNPFSVDPPALAIPSLEHRYVTVSFEPTSLQSFTGVFEATVEKGSDLNTKTLSFQMRGEGFSPLSSLFFLSSLSLSLLSILPIFLSHNVSRQPMCACWCVCQALCPTWWSRSRLRAPRKDTCA